MKKSKLTIATAILMLVSLALIAVTFFMIFDIKNHDFEDWDGLGVAIIAAIAIIYAIPFGAIACIELPFAIVTLASKNLIKIRKLLIGSTVLHAIYLCAYIYLAVLCASIVKLVPSLGVLSIVSVSVYFATWIVKLVCCVKLKKQLQEPDFDTDVFIKPDSVVDVVDYEITSNNSLEEGQQAITDGKETSAE